METIEEQLSRSELRELGISYFRNSNGDEEIRSDIFVIEQLSLHIDRRTLPALGENTWLVYDGRGDEHILIHADGTWAARPLRDLIW